MSRPANGVRMLRLGSLDLSGAKPIDMSPHELEELRTANKRPSGGEYVLDSVFTPLTDLEDPTQSPLDRQRRVTASMKVAQLFRDDPVGLMNRLQQDSR